MATSLDNLIDNYVQLKKDILFSKVNDEDLALFIDMTKKELKREIREEIEEEVKERALKKAQDEIEEKAGLRRIAEFKKLALDGFIVAIFVGLFVNQATEIIGHLKRTSVLVDIKPTIWLAIGFFFICVIIFLWRFLAELVKLIKKEHNDETN